jgi:hypothetical protein
MDIPLDPAKVLQQVQSGLRANANANAGFEPPSVDELSQHLPGFKIHELVGRGGMGAVYRATHLHLEREVALKVLPKELAADPAFTERFAREARALAILDHPHLLRVFDFGEASGYCYLVTEFVAGANLRQLMDLGELTPGESLRLLPAICDALQYAHDKGVVHRDIKPENLLLDGDGNVKIADFGLAKLTDETDDALTRSGQALGTPHYVAPEQMMASPAVDHRADLFSLGVVFYEMLTGEVPRGNFQAPSHHSSVSRKMDAVVMRSLERDPARRFQSANALGQAIAGGNVDPAEVDRLDRQRQVARSTRRQKQQITPWFALFLVLGGATYELLAQTATSGIPVWFGFSIGFVGCILGFRTFKQLAADDWWMAQAAAATAAWLPVLAFAEITVLGTMESALRESIGLSITVCLAINAAIIARIVANKRPKAVPVPRKPTRRRRRKVVDR